MWFSTPYRATQLPTGAVAIGGYNVTAISMSRDLGLTFDVDVNIRHYVDVMSRCLAALRQLSVVGQYITIPIVQSLMTSFVLIRVDYCNGIFLGHPATQLRRLQAVQNSAALAMYSI